MVVIAIAKLRLAENQDLRQQVCEERGRATTGYEYMRKQKAKASHIWRPAGKGAPLLRKENDHPERRAHSHLTS
eukprot:3811074-Pleurochrysis_carterae.AAC.1